jgi:hypothetical protein
MKRPFLLIVSGIILFIFSCKKDTFISSSDARISFSSDSLHFDTVFTTAGSTTQYFKVSNPNSQKLLINSIRLMGGENSAFKINIAGSSGIETDNIELAANDSIYVFVSVFINPNNSSLPFILQDSLQVSFNGNNKYVQLDAWGQNAHFLKNIKLTANTTWTNDLPYVILGGLQVDSNVSLTIQQGCRIYFHADAPLLVDGSLLVQGDKYDSSKVYFLSDRLDKPYSDYPGSWPGIYFRTSSKDNVLEFAVIKNAYQGVIAQDPSVNANPKLQLKECIIDNIFDAGILGIQTSIYARNCLVSNCGNNIVLGYGGNYQFDQCSIASFSNNYIQHLQPVLVVSNYFVQGNNTLVSPLSGIFTNCIFWGDNGSVDDEVTVVKQGDSTFKVSFDHCLWKATHIPDGVDTSGLMLNIDPLFELVNNQQRLYNFHLKAGSPAIDAGNDSLGILIDLDGNPRPVGLPDLGAYERQ